MMIANKFLCQASFLASLATCAPAFAGDSVATAPSLYGVGEIQVLQARIVNPKATAACGTSTGELSKLLIKATQTAKLPTFPVIGAPAKQENIERVNLVTDIVTIQPHDNECLSWISFSVQKRAALRVEPVSTARELTVTYWSGGLMTGSTQANHPTSIEDAVQKLSGELASQYFADQPPIIKDGPENILTKE
ncbi:MAG: hypothetical protein PHD48_05615 [Alphaproteobacteria bacterium]|nr:hypothetical protein [Alphaproteobacteria bacterium]